MIIEKGFGWKRQNLDHRDVLFRLQANTAGARDPGSVDLSTNINWVYDQGKESSCVAQSSSSLVRYVRKRQGLSEIEPSRNFIYWNARLLDVPPNTNSDTGTMIRNALVSMANNGYCAESLWGYNNSSIFHAPPAAAYDAAKYNLVSVYNSINQDRDSLQSCLVSGYPFLFGIEVFKSMMTDEVGRTGIVPLPDMNEKPIGGHAILCVGYNHATQQYKFLNSWGSDWGQNGYGFLPYDFLESQYVASDFWTITRLQTVSAQAIAAKHKKPWWHIW